MINENSTPEVLSNTMNALTFEKRIPNMAGYRAAQSIFGAFELPTESFRVFDNGRHIGNIWLEEDGWFATDPKYIHSISGVSKQEAVNFLLNPPESEPFEFEIT